MFRRKISFSSLESKFDPDEGGSTLVYIYHTTRRNIGEDRNPGTCSSRNVRSQIFCLLLRPDFGKRWWFRWQQHCRGSDAQAHCVRHMRPSHFHLDVPSRCSSWESSPEAGVRNLITSSGCVHAVNKGRWKQMWVICVITAVTVSKCRVTTGCQLLDRVYNQCWYCAVRTPSEGPYGYSPLCFNLNRDYDLYFV